MCVFTVNNRCAQVSLCVDVFTKKMYYCEIWVGSISQSRRGVILQKKRKNTFTFIFVAYPHTQQSSSSEEKSKPRQKSLWAFMWFKMKIWNNKLALREVPLSLHATSYAAPAGCKTQTLAPSPLPKKTYYLLPSKGPTHGAQRQIIAGNSIFTPWDFPISVLAGV